LPHRLPNRRSTSNEPSSWGGASMAHQGQATRSTSSMDHTHKFRVVAWWSSGQTGLVKSDSAPNAIHFTAPVAFGGFEGRWTPEDLLLGALSSCFTTTFRALAEHPVLEYIDLQVEVVGTVSPTDSGYRFAEVVIRANLTIPHQGDQERALKLLEKAKDACLVSRALAMQQTLEPVVTVGVPSPSA
jgi:peroxiredoxin-like protein